MSARILVVDDDDAVRRILQRVLEATGFAVVESAHPNTACQLYDADPAAIDLLLTDMKMPGMSGRQLATRLWTARPDLPVLFISGYIVPSYAVELNGPHSRFIEKPFSSEVLVALIEELLARRTGASRVHGPPA